ncbi:tetratricopeptide repeat protein [Streptomyces violaceus]
MGAEVLSHERDSAVAIEVSYGPAPTAYLYPALSGGSPPRSRTEVAVQDVAAHLTRGYDSLRPDARYERAEIRWPGEAHAYLRTRLAGETMTHPLDDHAPAFAEALGHLPLVSGCWVSTTPTLTSRANLAASYAHAGRTGEAIAIEERVVADSERLLGEDHPDTLVSRSNTGHPAGPDG